MRARHFHTGAYRDVVGFGVGRNDGAFGSVTNDWSYDDVTERVDSATCGWFVVGDAAPAAVVVAYTTKIAILVVDGLLVSLHP